MKAPTEVCPKGCNLQGEAIPKEYLEKGYYGDTTHYSRMIGFDGGREGIYDGVIFWMCPDCGVRWHRFTDPSDMRRLRTEELWKRMDANGSES